jgi:hypothetical protein
MRGAVALSVAGFLLVALCGSSQAFETGSPAAPATRMDWAGLGRDTAYVLGYEVAFGVPLYFATKASRHYASWGENVRDAQWDRDSWWINYIGHPYWGATYFMRARERGADHVSAFVYSALLSTLYEYGVEALFEPPSYNDLIVTPVAGALIGALIFEPLRETIKAKPVRAWYDDVVLVATDPIGAVNGVFEWMFGVTPNLQLQMRPPRSLPSAHPESRGRPAHGMSLEASFRF